jgi:hypothetical protein
MRAPENEIDPLLHPAQVAKLLAVSPLVGQVSPQRHWAPVHQDWARCPICYIRGARVHRPSYCARAVHRGDGLGTIAGGQDLAIQRGIGVPPPGRVVDSLHGGGGRPSWLDKGIGVPTGPATRSGASAGYSEMDRS